MNNKNRPPIPRRRRLLLGLFFLFIASGLGLIIYDLIVKETKDPANAAELTAHNPPEKPEDLPSISRTFSKAHFMRQITLLEEADKAQAALPLLLLRAAFSMVRQPAPAKFRFRMNRVLDSGHEYDAGMEVRLKPDGDSAVVELELLSGPGAPMTYQAHIVANRLKNLCTRVQNEHGEESFAPLNPSFVQDIPSVGIGDIDFFDLFGFAGVLFGTTTAEPVGFVEVLGSTKMLVFDLSFGPFLPSSPTHEEKDTTQQSNRDAETPILGRSRSALVYLTADGFRLRRLRVFDGLDHLVRTYGDFHFASSGMSSLRSFTVCAVPTSSHTFLRLDSAEPSDQATPVISHKNK